MGVGGIAYNLTPRQRVGRLDQVAERSPIAIGILGEDLQFVETNQAFRDFVGYSEEELDTMSFGDIFDGDELADRLRTGNSAVAATVTTSSGDSTPGSLLAFPLEEDGADGGLIGFFLDVPERTARFVKPALFARSARRT